MSLLTYSLGSLLAGGTEAVTVATPLSHNTLAQFNKPIHPHASVALQHKSTFAVPAYLSIEINGSLFSQIISF